MGPRVGSTHGGSRDVACAPGTSASPYDTVPFTDLSRSGSGARPPRRDVVALSPEHRTAFRDLLLGLDAPARLSRFACPLGDDGILQHMNYATREAAWIAGLFVANELCGVVELYECRDPQDIEAAFAVASVWRRQGIGTALLFAAIGWTRMSHRSRLRMMFSRHNWPMRRLASKAEPQLDLDMEELIASVMVGDRGRGADMQQWPARPEASPKRADCSEFIFCGTQSS